MAPITPPIDSHAGAAQGGGRLRLRVGSVGVGARQSLDDLGVVELRVGDHAHEEGALVTQRLAVLLGQVALRAVYLDLLQRLRRQGRLRKKKCQDFDVVEK